MKRGAVDRRGSAVVALPSATEILITRQFDAPAELIFQAWTRPQLVRRWWAGDRGEVTSVEVDLRVGGRWRWVMTANAGFEVAFHGVFEEISRPHRLVRTEVYEGAPHAPGVSELTLEEVGGATTMRLLVRHLSQANRDQHLASGMEGGTQAALDQLAAVLGELR